MLTNSRGSASQREKQTRAILEDMLVRPPNSQLAGAPMRLGSVLATGGSRDRQAQIVDAYWALTSATADYYLGLHEQDELTNLRNRLPTYDTSLAEAQSLLNSRVNTSLRAARAAQLRLGRLMGGGSRPLPADTPFSGKYATRYSEIFPNGGPEEARLLHELLPLRLGELHDAADGITRSEQWLKRVAADRGSGSSAAGMIRSLELLALNRRAFVQIARDYNQQINRYAMLASPRVVDSGRLVAMLIRTPGGSLASSSTFATGADESANLQFRPSGAPSRR